MNNFVELSQLDRFNELLLVSNERPVVLFKHSVTCGISSRAYEEMRSLKDPVNVLVVQHARALSNEVAHLTGIEHESPQAIVFRNGHPVWSGSHSQITAATISRVLQENR